MADAFEQPLRSSLRDLQKDHPDKVKVTPEKCFVGLDAYQKLIDSGVDVVLLATPPGFADAFESGNRCRQTCLLRKTDGHRCPGCSLGDGIRQSCPGEETLAGSRILLAL